MLIIILSAIGSSNKMPKNMITYVKSVTAWVKMSVDQYLLYGITDSYFFRACKV